MATFDKGILGGFSGKVGPVVGSYWKGKDVMRSRPRKRSGGSSVAQLDQQLKFSTAIEFVNPMTELVQLTFKSYTKDQSAGNVALSLILKNAIGGKTPDYVVLYDKALVSHGTLPNATAPAASVTGTSVHFTWTDNSGVGKADGTDLAVIVAYCPEQKQTLFTTTAATRSTGSGVLDVTNFSGKTIQTWIAFLAETGGNASDSLYTGELVVS